MAMIGIHMCLTEHSTQNSVPVSVSVHPFFCCTVLGPKIQEQEEPHVIELSWLRQDSAAIPVSSESQLLVIFLNCAFARTIRNGMPIINGGNYSFRHE